MCNSVFNKTINAAAASSLLMLAAAVYLCSCGSAPSKINTQKESVYPDKSVVYKSAIDSFISTLETGNVVLRMGRGPDSYMLSQLNITDKSWSHCGIVVIENGYPFVYHSIGGEDNPDERLRRDSVAFFVSADRNFAVASVHYDLNKAAIENLTGIVHSYYLQRPRFDMKFDLQTDSQLYCSEFIYKAITRAANDTVYIPKSRAYARAFVGIDDLFLNLHAQLKKKLSYK